MTLEEQFCDIDQNLHNIFFSRKLRLTKALHFHQLMTDAKDLVTFTKTPERNEADVTTLLEKYDEIINEVKNYENTIKSLDEKQNSKRNNLL